MGRSRSDQCKVRSITCLFWSAAHPQLSITTADYGFLTDNER